MRGDYTSISAGGGKFWAKMTVFLDFFKAHVEIGEFKNVEILGVFLDFEGEDLF